MVTVVTTVQPPWLPAGGVLRASPTSWPSLKPSSSLRVCNRLAHNASSWCPPLHSCSPCSTSFFSGLSLGLVLTNVGASSNRCRRLVVRAGKFALCQTKRNRSKKSLARTHGFRRRMRTTSGRAVLRRRRAKGRKVLCTKSNPSRGK